MNPVDKPQVGIWHNVLVLKVLRRQGTVKVIIVQITTPQWQLSDPCFRFVSRVLMNDALSFQSPFILIIKSAGGQTITRQTQNMFCFPHDAECHFPLGAWKDDWELFLLENKAAGGVCGPMPFHVWIKLLTRLSFGLFYFLLKFYSPKSKMTLEIHVLLENKKSPT